MSEQPESAQGPEAESGGSGGEGTEKPRRSLLWRGVRGAVRALTVLIVLVIVLCGVALLLLQTDWGRARALELVVAYLNSQIRGEIRAERMTGNVLDDLTLHGVVILDPEGDVVAQADSLYIDHALLPLFVGDVVIHRARVERPRFVLLDREGRVGIVRTFETIEPQPVTEPTTQLDLEHLEIVDGTVMLSAAESATGVVGLDATLGVGVDGDRVTWKAAELSAQLVNAPFDVIETFTARSSGYYDPDALLSIEVLELEAAGLEIALHGQARDFGEGQPAPTTVDVRIDRIYGDLAKLGQVPPGTEGDLPLLGTATVTGRVVGPAEALEVTLEVATEEAGRLTVAGIAGYDRARERPHWDLELTLSDGYPSRLVAGLPSLTQALHGLDAVLRLRGAGMPDEVDGWVEAKMEVSRVEGDATLSRLAPVGLDLGVRHGGQAQLYLRTLGERAPGVPMLRLEATLGSVFALPTPLVASWRIRDLELESIAGLPGLEALGGIEGQVARLDGRGRLLLTEDGMRQLAVTAQVDASRLRVPAGAVEGLDGAATAGQVRGELQVAWSGDERGGGGAPPSGRADLVVRELAVQGARVERGELELRLEPLASGTRLVGELAVDGAAYADDLRVAHVSGPFDLVLGAGGTIPRGALELTVRDGVFGETRLREATADVALSLKAGGELAVDGPVSLSGLRQGRVVEVASASGELTLHRSARGRLEASVPDLTARGVRINDGAQSVASVQGPVAVVLAADGALEATLDVTARELRVAGVAIGEVSGPVAVARGAGGQVEAGGAIDASDVAIGGTTIGRVQGPVDVSVGADGAVDARANLDAHEVEADGASAGRVQGPIDVSLGADGALEASAELEAHDVAAGAVRVGAVEGSLELSSRGGRTQASGALRGRDVAQGASQRAERAQVQGTVRVSGRGAEQRIQAVGTVRAEDVRAAGDVRAAVVTAEVDLEVRGAVPQGSVVVSAQGARVGDRPFERVVARAQIDAGGQAQVVAQARGTQGERVDAALEVQLPVAGHELAARVERAELVGRSGRGLRLVPGSELRIGADGALVAREVRVEGIGGLAGTLAVDADWNPQAGRYELALVARDVGLREWLGTIEELTGIAVAVPGDLDARIDLVAELHGTGLERPQGRATLWLRDARGLMVLEGIDVDVDVYLDAEELFVTGVAVWAPQGRLELDLELPAEVVQLQPFGLALERTTRFELEGTLVGVELRGARDVLPAPPVGRAIEGSVTAELFVDGTLGEPRGALTAQLTGIGLGPLAGVDGTIEALIEPDEMRVEADLAHATSEGQAALLQLDAQLPFNPISLVLEDNALETVRERLEARGFAVVVEVPELELATLPYVEELPVQLHNARVSLDAQMGGSLSAPKMAVLARAVVPRLLVEDEEVEIRVAITDEAHAVPGTPSASDLYGRVTVSSPSGGLLIGSMRLPEAMDVVFARRTPREVVQDERFWLEAAARIDPEDMARLLPSSARGLLGAMPEPQFAARLEMTGGADGPTGQLQATLESTALEGGERVEPGERPARVLDRVALGGPVLARRLQVMADLGGASSVLRAELTRDEPGSAPLQLEVEVAAGVLTMLDGELRDGTAVAGQLVSQGYDLRGIETLLPEVFAPTEGRLMADAQLSGTYGRPQLSGQVVASFDRLHVRPLGLVREDLSLTVLLEEDAIRLEPVRLESGNGGTLVLEAEVGTPSLAPSRMPLSGSLLLRDFPLVARPDVTARLSGELELGGTLGVPEGVGSFVVEDAQVSVARLERELASTEPPEAVVFVDDLEAVTLARAVERLEREQREARRAERRALAGAESRFEIDVSIPRYNVRVVHPLFDVMVWGDVELALLGSVPVAEGLVNLEGMVNLYGREFELAQDSRVIFRGVPGIDPRLQISAAYDISEVDLSPLGLTAQDDSRIYVDVAGTLSAPVLELRSDPPMDQTNIASIVAFGAPTGAAEDDADAIQQQTANLFVALLSGQLGGMVEDQLPVDVLTVTGEGRVTVGKRISRRLVVLYRGNPGADEDENANEIQAKLRIYDWLNLEARFGDAGLGTVDLLFRRQW